MTRRDMFKGGVPLSNAMALTMPSLPQNKQGIVHGIIDDFMRNSIYTLCV